MLKKVLGIIMTVCMALTALTCAVSADEITELEAAMTAISKGKDTALVFNDMTADEFLRSMKKLLPEGSTVELSFSKESDYRIYNATSTKDGSIFANIQFTCDVYTRHEMYDIKLPMLTGDAAAANADVENLAADIAAIKAAFANRSLPSNTTKEDVLKEAQAAVKNGSVVDFDGDCIKVDSTVAKAGSIKLVLKVTLNKESSTVKIFNGLKMLDEETPTEPVTETKPAEETKPAQNNVNFADVKADAYYADAVKWAVEKNITAGTSATTFSPDDTCTKAQILTFLWRAVGSPKSETANPFEDVETDYYYYYAALWAYEMGMVNDSKTFDGDAPCTRAMTVTYLWLNADAPDTPSDTAFTDVPEHADFAEAVAWAVENGVTSGTSATTFSPDEICSRGQIVTFLNRAIQ